MLDLVKRKIFPHINGFDYVDFSVRVSCKITFIQGLCRAGQRCWLCSYPLRSDI